MQKREGNYKKQLAITTNLIVFCDAVLNIPMGCLDAILLEQLLNHQNVIFLVSEGHGENLKITTLPVHLQWLFTCMDQLSWRQMQRRFSVTFFASELMDHLVFVKNAMKHKIFMYEIENGYFVDELAKNVLKLMR